MSISIKITCICSECPQEFSPSSATPHSLQTCFDIFDDLRGHCVVLNHSCFSFVFRANHSFFICQTVAGCFTCHAHAIVADHKVFIHSLVLFFSSKVEYFSIFCSQNELVLLKYGFYKKSLRKGAPLTSCTLISSQKGICSTTGTLTCKVIIT